MTAFWSSEDRNRDDGAMEKMGPPKTRSWSSISSYQGPHLSQAPFSCESIRGLDQGPPQGSTNQRNGH